MDFGTALAAVKAGHRAAREGWNGKDMFIFLVPGSTFTVNRAPLLGIYPEGTQIRYHPHIDMKTAQGYVVPWLASQADMLADDWTLVADTIDFVERLKIENADWLDTLSIRNPEPTPSDPLGQRGTVAVVRKDGTGGITVVTDMVDEAVLRDVLGRLRR